MKDTILDSLDYKSNFIVNDVRRPKSIAVPYQTAWRDHEMFLSCLNGSDFQSPARLYSYLASLAAFNTGSFLKYESKNGHFHQFFVSFKAYIHSFLHYRPFISVDAWHLRGPYKYQIFTTVTQDFDNFMLPISFVLLYQGYFNDWVYFLNFLKGRLGCLSNDLIILSDI